MLSLNPIWNHILHTRRTTCTITRFPQMGMTEQTRGFLHVLLNLPSEPNLNLLTPCHQQRRFVIWFILKRCHTTAAISRCAGHYLALVLFKHQFSPASVRVKPASYFWPSSVYHKTLWPISGGWGKERNEWVRRERERKKACFVLLEELLGISLLLFSFVSLSQFSFLSDLLLWY